MCVSGLSGVVLDSAVGEREKRKVEIHFAFTHTAFSGAVVTDRTAVQPRRQQVKPTHTDFDPFLQHSRSWTYFVYSK